MMADTVDILFTTNADKAAQSTRRAANETKRAEQATDDLADEQKRLNDTQEKALILHRKKLAALKKETLATKKAAAATKARKIDIGKEALAQGAAGGGALGRLSPVAGGISAGKGIGGAAGLAVAGLAAASVAAGVALEAFSGASQRAMKAAEELTKAQHARIDMERAATQKTAQRAAGAAGTTDPSLRRIQAGVGTEAGQGLIDVYGDKLTMLSGSAAKAMAAIADVADNPKIRGLEDKLEALRTLAGVAAQGGSIAGVGAQITSDMMARSQAAGGAPLATRFAAREMGISVEQQQQRAQNLMAGDLGGAGQRMSITGQTQQELLRLSTTAQATGELRTQLAEVLNPLAAAQVEANKQRERALRILEERRDAQGNVGWILSYWGRRLGTGAGTAQDQIDDMTAIAAAGL